MPQHEHKLTEAMGWFTFPAEQSALAAFPPGCSVIRMVQCQEKTTNDTDDDDNSKSSIKSKNNDNDNDNDSDSKASASRGSATPNVTCPPSKSTSNSSTNDVSTNDVSTNTNDVDVSTRMEIQVGRIKAVGVNLSKTCTREMMYKFEHFQFPLKNNDSSNNDNDESKDDDDDLDRSNWVPERELQFAPHCPIWFTSMESSHRGEETRRSAQVLGSYHAPDASNNDVLYSIKVYATSRNTNSNSSTSASPSSSSSSSNNNIIHHGVKGSQISFRSASTATINTNRNSNKVSSPRTNSAPSTSSASILSQEQLPTPPQLPTQSSSLPINMNAICAIPPPPLTHHTLTSQPLAPLVQQEPSLPLPPPPPQRIRLLQLPLWIDYQVVQELIAEGFKQESQYITFVPSHRSIHKDCPCPEFPHVRFTGMQASQNIVDKFVSFLRLTLHKEAWRIKYNNEIRVWENPLPLQQQRPQQHGIPPPPPPPSTTAAVQTQQLPASVQQQPQHLPVVLPTTTQNPQILHGSSLRSSPVLLLPTPMNASAQNGEDGGSDGCSSITEPEPPVSQDRKYNASSSSHNSPGSHDIPTSRTNTKRQAKRRRSDPRPQSTLVTTNRSTIHTGHPNHLDPILSDGGHHDSLDSNSNHKRRRVWPYYNPNAKTTELDRLMTLQMIPDWFPSKKKAFEILSKKRGNSGSWSSLIYARTGCTLTLNVPPPQDVSTLSSSSSTTRLTTENTTHCTSTKTIKPPKADIVITGPNEEQLQHAEELMDDGILQIFCRPNEPKVLYSLAANRQRRTLPLIKEGDDDHERLSLTSINQDGLLYQRFRIHGGYRKEWMRLVPLPNAKSGGAVIGKKGARICKLRKQFAGTHFVIETEGAIEPFILLAGSDKSEVEDATKVVANLVRTFIKREEANARKAKALSLSLKSSSSVTPTPVL